MEKITHVAFADIKYKKPKTIKLSNISGENYEEVSLPLKNHYFLDNNVSFKMDFYDAFILNDNEDPKVKFYLKELKTTNSELSSIEALSLKVTPGYKHTSVIKLINTCGAYLGPNKTKFREFMCHDLGLPPDYWDKPVINAYAWGKKAPVNKRSNNLYSEKNYWPESENPCPTGFRVPTRNEWKDVFRYNPQEKEKIYNTDWAGKAFNWKIGDRLVFFHTGFEYYFQEIWSKTAYDKESAYIVFGTVNYINIAESSRSSKHLGLSVRCIRKEPHER